MCSQTLLYSANPACIRLFHFSLSLVFHHLAVDCDLWPLALWTLEMFAMWWESQRMSLWNAQTSSVSGIDNYAHRVSSPFKPLCVHTVRVSEWLISCCWLLWSGYLVYANITYVQVFLLLFQSLKSTVLLEQSNDSCQVNEQGSWASDWCSGDTSCDTSVEAKSATLAEDPTRPFLNNVSKDWSVLRRLSINFFSPDFSCDRF